MTNKQRFISGINTLIRQYDNPTVEIMGILFSDVHCPLCKTVGAAATNGCIPCPQALGDKSNDDGCALMPTFQDARDMILPYPTDMVSGGDEDLIAALKARADWWRSKLPILEALPEFRFTKAGWRRIDEMFDGVDLSRYGS